MTKTVKMIGNLKLNQNERDAIIKSMNIVRDENYEITMKLGNKVCATYLYKNTKVKIVGTVVRIISRVNMQKVTILTDHGHVIMLPLQVPHISYTILKGNTRRARRAYLTYLIKRIQKQQH